MKLHYAIHKISFRFNIHKATFDLICEADHCPSLTTCEKEKLRIPNRHFSSDTMR